MLDLLVDKIKNNGDKNFYKINNDSITYYELYNKILLLSDNLKKQGNGPVIVYGHKSISQVISIISCVIAKRCYIPIDLCTPIERIREIIFDSNSTLLIKNESIEINDIECLSVKEINDKYKDYNLYYDTSKNNTAYIIFTSGSTGTSKGVPISYDNLNNFISWVINSKEFSLCSNLTVMSEASFAFDLSVMDLYFSLYMDASIVGIDNECKNNLRKLYDTINDNKINFMIMTPTFVKMLLIDNNFNSLNFSFIKYMFFCGECLEVSTVKKIRCRFPNVHIINAYGPTESTCFVSMVEIDNDMLDNDYLPVGDINNTATGIEIKNDEIILSGKSVFSGYLNFNSKDCYKINNINYYNTKDVGRINDKYLYCIGRMDNQIKYMGYRIELNDIENNLLKIDGISEAVVVCKYKDNSNIVRIINAYVVLNKDISTIEIKNELLKLIPSYMIPKNIVILDEMPKTCNDKYDRRSLISCD